MSVLADHLDAKLKSLDARAAFSLETVVRDAMKLADTQSGVDRTGYLPPDFITRIASDFGSEPFERPTQSDSEKCEGWSATSNPPRSSRIAPVLLTDQR